eukprot:754124-Hanusia_phi.AAC.1
MSALVTSFSPCRYQSSMSGLMRGRGSASVVNLAVVNPGEPLTQWRFQTEFSCPLCRGLGNNLVPLVAKDLLWKEAQDQEAEEMQVEEHTQQQEQGLETKQPDEVLLNLSLPFVPLPKPGKEKGSEKSRMYTVDSLFGPYRHLLDSKKLKFQRTSQANTKAKGGNSPSAPGNTVSGEPEKEMAEAMAKKIVETHLIAHEEGGTGGEGSSYHTLAAISSCIYSIFSIESACRLGDSPPPPPPPPPPSPSPPPSPLSPSPLSPPHPSP